MSQKKKVYRALAITEEGWMITIRPSGRAGRSGCHDLAIAKAGDRGCKYNDGKLYATVVVADASPDLPALSAPTMPLPDEVVRQAHDLVRSTFKQ